MKKFTLNLRMCVFFSACTAISLFSSFDLPEENTVYIQAMLIKYYDNDAQMKDVKRYEINVTNNGFCRYRKVFNNGKQEYAAFNLSRFKSMDFYGTSTRGELYLRTRNDDVIMQTRNDKTGEVDSMATFMVIPLKNIDVDELNALASNFKKANATLLTQK